MQPHNDSEIGLLHYPHSKGGETEAQRNQVAYLRSVGSEGRGWRKGLSVVRIGVAGGAPLVSGWVTGGWRCPQYVGHVPRSRSPGRGAGEQHRVLPESEYWGGAGSVCCTWVSKRQHGAVVKNTGPELCDFGPVT